ncbi:hypothetical protein EMCRGX_G012010 [Ephydatia muelleri]
MDNCASLIIVAVAFLCRVFVCISQIVKGPSNRIVSPDDTAVFNCSLSCAQQLSVIWYLTLPTNSRTVTVSPYTSLSQVKNIYGIEVARGTVNECSQGGYIVEQLFVKAKQQLNLMPVQCSSVCFEDDCTCGDHSMQVQFSKLGVLRVASPSIAESALCSSVAYITITVTVTSGPTPTPLASPQVTNF